MTRSWRALHKTGPNGRPLRGGGRVAISMQRVIDGAPFHGAQRLGPLPPRRVWRALAPAPQLRSMARCATLSSAWWQTTVITSVAQAARTYLIGELH